MKNFLQNSSRERAKAVGNRRRETLRRFGRLKKHHSAAKAAAIVGASVPTLWRWQKKLTARGIAGLQPKQFKSGRRSPFSKIRLTAKAVRDLESRIVEKNSPRAGWIAFANLSPACPPLVARQVLRFGRAPARFAAVGRVSPVQARGYVSADGRRLFIKLPCKGVLTAQLAVPPKLKLARLAQKTA
jgi:hypothetical protein